MILGTAGHVDHGKTALIKALTGIDTDRLPEEKRRGITLELGFAHLTLEGGPTLGVVDVPGHELFVKAMAAGAGGIDLALLVVAADEGVMPQTREHVDICELLGVHRGLLVVTKADLLPELWEGWLSLLEADIRALVAGTFLEGAPLHAVSAKTGAGLDPLRVDIARVAGAVRSQRSSDGPLFLPVDRAFSMKGFGCVVTGTLLSGSVEVSDDLSLLPGLPGPLRLRGIQRYGSPVERACAGERVALNLVGLEAGQIRRGMTVTRFEQLHPVRTFDARVTLLSASDRPLPRRSRQLITVGTSHAEAVVQVLGAPQLHPGESGFAQVRLSTEVAALPRQRFVMRGTRTLPGRGATLGGGEVLAIGTPRRRRGAEEKLARLATADLEGRLEWLLAEAGYRGLSETELQALASAAPKEVSQALSAAGARGVVVLVDRDRRRYLSGAVFKGLGAKAVSTLEAFHQSTPAAPGMAREELRQRLGIPGERTFQKLLATLQESKQLVDAKELLHRPGQGRTLSASDTSLKESLAAVLRQAALGPPTVSELASRLKTPPERIEALLKAMVVEGTAVRAGELHFDRAAVDALKDKVLAFLRERGSMTTQELKELTGQSRKFVIPLAEYFDRERVTLRVGDTRVARRPS